MDMQWAGSLLVISVHLDEQPHEFIWDDLLVAPLP